MTAVRPIVLAFAGVAALVVPGCGPPTHFDEALVLGGETVSADALNAGREYYSFYCFACHGEDGDGRGPASLGLVTPPRDFRVATFKFAAVEEGTLPHDEDLIRIVRGGLSGTAMLEWDIPEPVLQDVVQYIKTFSPEGEGWRDPDMEKGDRIVAGDDPWGDARRAEAVARGREVYHGTGTCYSCHPAYEARAEINAHRAAFEQPALSKFRSQIWLSEAKPSPSYSTPIPGDPACEAESDCGEDGTQVCRYGRCERKVIIVPPDFSINEMRAGDTVPDLYRLIATGIPGTAMPMWKGSLVDADIWAMAHFVNSLTAQKSTNEVAALKTKLQADAR